MYSLFISEDLKISTDGIFGGRQYDTFRPLKISEWQWELADPQLRHCKCVPTPYAL